MLRIINDTGLSNHTKVTTEDREVLSHIAGIDICMRPGKPVTAIITMNLSYVDCMVEPIFTEDELIEIASKHGYSVVKVLPHI